MVELQLLPNSRATSPTRESVRDEKSVKCTCPWWSMGIALWLIGTLAILLPALPAVIPSLPWTASDTTVLGRNTWRWCILGAIVYTGPWLGHALLKIFYAILRRRLKMVHRERIMYIQRLHWIAIATITSCTAFISWQFLMTLSTLGGPVTEDTCLIETGSSILVTTSSDSNYQSTCTALDLVSRIISCFALTCIALLLEQILVQRVAYRFHRRAFRDRVAKNQFACMALDRLVRVRKHSEHRWTLGTAIENRAPDTPLLRDFRAFKKNYVDNVPAMAAAESIRRESEPKEDLDQAMEDKTTKEGRRLAQGLFVHMCRSGSELLSPQDFASYFPGNAKLMMDVFNIFDLDKSGQITRREFEQCVIDILREKYDLTRARLDTDNALRALDRLLIVVTLFICMFVWLTVWDVNLQSVLTLTVSMIVAANIIVGQTASNVTQSVVFLFVVHAYDVGDTVRFDNVKYSVQTVYLLNTVFRRYDGQLVYYPHSALLNKEIVNSQRSRDLYRKVTIDVKPETTGEQIDRMRAHLNAFIKENASDYSTKLDFEFVDTVSLDKVTFSLVHQQLQTSDMTKRWTRYARFVQEVIKAMQECGIECLSTMTDKPKILDSSKSPVEKSEKGQ